MLVMGLAFADSNETKISGAVSSLLERTTCSCACRLHLVERGGPPEQSARRHWRVAKQAQLDHIVGPNV